MLYAAFFNVMPPRFEGVFYYSYESAPRERVRKRTLCSSIGNFYQNFFCAWHEENALRCTFKQEVVYVTG